MNMRMKVWVYIAVLYGSILTLGAHTIHAQPYTVMMKSDDVRIEQITIEVSQNVIPD